MKSIISMKRTLAVFLVVCMILLAGCNQTPPVNTDPGNVEKSHNLNFVIVDDTNLDKEITLGDYKYTIAINLKEDGSLEVVGTCTGRVETQAGGQQGGQQGGSGGGQEETEPTDPPETIPPLTAAEKEALKFTQTGTWAYEKGYGYTITIGDQTTKTHYDKASARQCFFIELVHQGVSTGLLEFQAKDTSFRGDMAADYVRWEDREAQIYFYYANTNTGNNPNSTRLWVLPNGQAASLVYSGSSYTYKRGTWTQEANGNVNINIGGSVTTCYYCSETGKEGYRVSYNNQTIYSRTDVEYTLADFDGVVVKSLKCSEGDITLDLTSKGYAVLMQGQTSKASGTYTEANGVLTVVVAGQTYVSEGNIIAMNVTISSTNECGCESQETVNRTFYLDGNVPEGGGQQGGQPGGQQGGQPGGDQGGQTPGGDQGGQMPGGDQGGQTPGGDQGGQMPGGDQGGSEGGEGSGGGEG